MKIKIEIQAEFPIDDESTQLQDLANMLKKDLGAAFDIEYISVTGKTLSTAIHRIKMEPAEDAIEIKPQNEKSTSIKEAMNLYIKDKFIGLIYHIYPYFPFNNESQWIAYFALGTKIRICSSQYKAKEWLIQKYKEWLTKGATT